MSKRPDRGTNVMNRHERRRAQKLQKPETPMKMFVEEVSARNSETGHDELYLVINGQRVAYRGHPGTPQARTWVPLVDHISFHDDEPDDGTRVLDAGVVEWMPEPKGARQ